MINGTDIVGIILTLGCGFIIGCLFMNVITLMKNDDKEEE